MAAQESTISGWLDLGTYLTAALTASVIGWDGHTMLVMMYQMLRDEVDYRELGHDYLDKLQPQRLTMYLVKRLESLGHKVTVTHEDQAA
jgi:hypothetical protein